MDVFFPIVGTLPETFASENGWLVQTIFSGMAQPGRCELLVSVIFPWLWEIFPWFWEIFPWLWEPWLWLRGLKHVFPQKKPWNLNLLLLTYGPMDLISVDVFFSHRLFFGTLAKMIRMEILHAKKFSQNHRNSPNSICFLEGVTLFHLDFLEIHIDVQQLYRWNWLIASQICDSSWVFSTEKPPNEWWVLTQLSK